MSPVAPPPDSWEPCPAGTVAAVASTCRRRRRLGLVARAAAVGTLGIVALGFALFGTNRAPVAAPEAGPPGGIECADVMRNVDGFLAGRLDRETTAKVEQHLAACPMCGPYVRGMRTTAVETTPVFGSPELVAHVDDFLVRRAVRSAAVR